MKTILLASLAVLASLTPAAAQESVPMVELKGDAPVTLRTDRAYLLFRSNTTRFTPVLLRVPTDTEMASYAEARRKAFAKAEPELIRKREDLLARKAEADRNGWKWDKPLPPVPSLDNFDFVYDKIVNAQAINTGRSFEKSSDERTVLVEAMPGDYVLYGIGWPGVVATCFCLGSVSFPAEPGKITDLGAIFIDKADGPTTIPELAGETGFGASVNGHSFMLAGAIRPASAAMHVPALLAGKAIAPAAYRATGKFTASFAFNINRLAPIPGVLGYDRGKVIDLVTGKVAPNQYD